MLIYSAQDGSILNDDRLVFSLYLSIFRTRDHLYGVLIPLILSCKFPGP